MIFDHNGHKLWLTNICVLSGSSTSFMSSLLRPFFTENISWQFFLFENLIMTLLCLPARWQASILSLEISQPTFLKILGTLSLSSFSLTDSSTPATSKHFLLEYWAFAQHCLSKSVTLCWSKELTFFVTSSCDSRLVNLSFTLRTSSSILVLDCISVWSDIVQYLWYLF